MRSPLAAGARFVLLDGAVTPVDMAPGEIGLAYTWRCGPASRDIGNPSYLDVQHAFTGRGPDRSARRMCAARARPAISPSPGCAAPASAATAGTPSRCRSAEETRALRDRHPRRQPPSMRTLATTSPTATYTAAQQTADFGAPQPSISLRVYQLSTVFGRGTPRAATL